MKDPRAEKLHPDYEMRYVPEYSISGYVAVNKKTGEVCKEEYKWNEEGTELRCIHCNYDGT